MTTATFDRTDRLRIQDLLSRRDIAWDTLLAIAEVGSTAHGISLEGTDDLDLTLIRIEPFDELVYGSESRQSMMIRTQLEGERSRVGDIDLQIYTARKFTRLACGGNPSILNVLYVPEYRHLAPWGWQEFRAGLRAYTPSIRAGSAFLGYMRQQMERWVGTRGQKNVNRPELVEAYGFDTKYAAHLIRLGYQGKIYMETGTIPIPLPKPMADAIKSLRTGGLTETEALKWARDIENELHEAIVISPLPQGPNIVGANRVLAELYFDRIHEDCTTE